MLLKIVLNCRYSNLCGSLVREHKDTGRDAAECDALYAVFFGNLQTGPVAGRKLLLVMLCQSSIDNWTYGVNCIKQLTLSFVI